MKQLRIFSLYTFIGFLNAGIGFFVLPILTHYLTPADYGVISLMNTYVTILMPVIGLCTSALVGVEYFNKELSPKEFRVLFSSVRAFPLLMAVPFAILFILGSRFLPGLMALPMEGYWLLLPLTLFVLYQDNFQSFLVISKRSFLFSITTLGKVIIEIPLTVLLVVYARMHWDGRIYAWLIAVAFFTFLSIYFYKKWNLLVLTIKKAYVRQALVFGTPLILHEMSKFVINQSDRLFITKMVSMEAMGLYSVGYQVGLIMLIVASAFSNFFAPFLFERLNKNTLEKKIEIVRLSYVFIVGMFVLLIIVTLLTPAFFTYLISDRFALAAQYVFWIGLSYWFWSIYLVFTNYIFYLKRTKILGYLAVLNVALNLICNYFFIKAFGTIGAAYATCLSFSFICIAVAIIAQRLYPMPWLAFDKIFKKSHQ